MNVIVVGLCVGWSVGRSVCQFVRTFSPEPWLWWIPNMDRYSGRAAQQESGAVLSKHGIFTWGPKIIYDYKSA